MTRSAVLAGWAFLALLFVACEALSILSRGRFTGLQGLLDRLTRGNVAFAAVFVGWMWLGWHFFAR
jgi:hypothetical protein